MLDDYALLNYLDEQENALSLRRSRPWKTTTASSRSRKKSQKEIPALRAPSKLEVLPLELLEYVYYVLFHSECHDLTCVHYNSDP